PLIARSAALQIDPSPPNPVTTQSDWNCEKSASPITGTVQNFSEFRLNCSILLFSAKSHCTERAQNGRIFV
ncbi:MAG: hypothetical protein MJE77_26455, partial [Proteobacteria bacterium]|nr:hypothetical protein [Pseudomonadota bacterium]